MKSALLFLSVVIIAGCGGTMCGSEARTNFGEQVYAEVRGYTVRPTPKENKTIPEGLRISQEEADSLNAKIMAEEASIGYVPKRGL